MDFKVAEIYYESLAHQLKSRAARLIYPQIISVIFFVDLSITLFIFHYLINIMLLSQLVERNEHIVDKVDNFHSVHLRTNGYKAIQVTKHHGNVLKILK